MPRIGNLETLLNLDGALWSQVVEGTARESVTVEAERRRDPPARSRTV